MHHVVLTESLQAGWSCLDNMQRAGLFLYPGASIGPAHRWSSSRHDIIKFPDGRVDDVSVITSEQQIFGKRFDGQILVPTESFHTDSLKMYVRHDRVNLEPVWHTDPWTKFWPAWVAKPNQAVPYENGGNQRHIVETLKCLMISQLT